MKKTFDVKKTVLLGLLSAILIVMACTPLGYLHAGAVEISFNVIPVAIGTIALGPMGGAVTGAVFGITSFLQCLGILGSSPFGAALFEISPVSTIIMCIVPRILSGFLTGLIFNVSNKLTKKTPPSCFVAGFFSAFLNTAFFMTSLVLLFGKSDYVKSLIDGRNYFVFICAFVGINAVFEILASTIVSGAIGTALHKAGLLSSKTAK